MENIITNPGLRDVAEKIFLNLDVEKIQMCGLVKQSCQQLIDGPFFWLRKFLGLSEDNKKDWIKVIQSLKTSEKEKAIISYLQWNLKKDVLVDLPCYTSFAIQDDFKKKIREICWMEKVSDEDVEMIKILSPLTNIPNVPDSDGRTSIVLATTLGHLEFVKIWDPLANIPSTSTKYGETLISMAACDGHTEIVKILAHLTDNPNAPDSYGYTPITIAACNGHLEIVKILASLTDNPNAPDKDGYTPLYWAEKNGNWEIVKILKSFKTF